jgi:hypothetical protein
LAFTFVGWDDLGYHPDHMASGKRTLDAQFDSGVPLLWPDEGASWPVKSFYMFGFNEYTNYVALDSISLSKKIDSYLQHKTQYPNPALVTSSLTWVVCRNVGEY